MRSELILIPIVLVVVVMALLLWQSQAPSEDNKLTEEEQKAPTAANAETAVESTARAASTIIPSAALTPTSTMAVVTDSNMGPLRIHPENSRYFINSVNEVVYLTGSHHWDNLVDNDTRPGEFDFTAYLDFLQTHNHNFIRLWSQWAWVQPVAPSPYMRIGPGLALDGQLKFDLSSFNQAYFDRLRSRVKAAQEREIYVAVVLFQGWSIEDRGSGNPWVNHPYNGANNVNQVDGDLNGNGEGEEIHTLANTAVLALQEAYVQKVIDTLNDLDNVLYEISNESPANSTAWQYHMVNFIREYERTKPQQHLVGMSSGGGRDKITNADIFAGPADWVAPNYRGGYRDDPPVPDGSKVVIADSDHIFGIGGDGRWVWQSFLRGLHPIYMDDFGSESWKEEARVAMGQTRAFAEKINMPHMRPLNNLASSKFCLANPASLNAEYLVYLPDGGRVTVNLKATPGPLEVTWFDPSTGESINSNSVQGGDWRTFSSPFRGAAVLYLHSSSGP